VQADCLTEFDDEVSRGGSIESEATVYQSTCEQEHMYATPEALDAPRSIKVFMRYSCRETIPGLFEELNSRESRAEGNIVAIRVRVDFHVNSNICQEVTHR
jgi:hypothetical protein